MKKFLFALFLFTSLCADPLIVTVLMVKDEEQVMEKTLQPMFDGGIDTFLIYDTGSTDRTVEVAQEFFQKHNLTSSTIFQEPFVDFAASRNRALDIAERQYPDADFFLMPDAEWYMVNTSDLVAFCRENADKDEHAYMIRIIGPQIDFYTTRLIRNNSVGRFEGAVHEVIMPPSMEKLSKDIYFDLRVGQRGQQKSEKRWIRDREILTKSYYENPHNPRTAFYLAQTCAALGDFESAYQFYKKRTEVKGWDEENFYAMYKLGLITGCLTTEERDTWPEALSYLLTAHAMRPHRIEPLVAIAARYAHMRDYANAYLFSKRAMEMPYPYEDLLFVEKQIYTFARYDLFAQSAWVMGDKEGALAAFEKALEAHPTDPHLHVNYCVFSKGIHGRVQAYPQKLHRKLLITGCPRSGTGFAAELFNRMGLNFGHEFLGRDGCSCWGMAVDADSSPWGPPAKNIEFEHIFHQVRHPIAAISSIQLEFPESWDYICEHIPQICPNDNLLTKCAKFWYYWNLKAQEKAEFTYRVEDIENQIPEFSKRLGIALNSEVVSAIPKNRNSRQGHYNPIEWKDLKEELDPELYANIRKLAKSYGYDY